MKKQVLTINECYSDNLGDQAIAKSLNNLFEQQGYDVIQADYTGNVLNDKSKIHVERSKASIKTKIISLIKKIEIIRLFAWTIKHYKRVNSYINRDIDFAIIGGGQLILSNPHFPIAMYLWTLLLKKQSKGIYFFAVGSGERFSSFDHYLIKKSLSRADSIFVRDRVSQEKIKEEFGVNSIVIPDVAYSFPVSTKLTSERQGGIVGIVDYTVFTRYAGEIGAEIVSEQQYMELWLDKILEYKLNSISLLATTDSDLELSKKFYTYVKSKKLGISIQLIDRLLSLDDYCECLNNSKYIFSGRMHSLILGERFGCTSIAWPISKKITSYEAERQRIVSLEDKSLLLNRALLSIIGYYRDKK